MAHQLFETDIKLIIAHIKAGLATALAEVRTRAADGFVDTNPTAKYFFYKPIHAYETPAIVMDPVDGDTRLLEVGANHINALLGFNLYCVLQDRDQERLAIRAFRWMNALSTVLTGAVLTSSDDRVKIVIKVERYSFGDDVTTSQDSKVPAGAFQKGLMIQLGVEHYEQI